MVGVSAGSPRPGGPFLSTLPSRAAGRDPQCRPWSTANGATERSIAILVLVFDEAFGGVVQVAGGTRDICPMQTKDCV